MRKRSSRIWLLPDEKFRELVSSSKTYTGVLKFFGLENKGGNSVAIKNRMKELKITTDHFNQRGKSREPIPLELILVKGSKYNRTLLKRRLITCGILENKCNICDKPPVWNNLPLIMILDHINGDSTDNRLLNLRLVCPDCNSQLPTFAARNKKKVEGNYCQDCGKEVWHSSERCSPCAKSKRVKIAWPSTVELKNRLKTNSCLKVAKDLGVSDNTVRKRLKNHPNEL